MNRYDFQNLAEIRIKDARVLLRSGRYEGCYYLSGYVVECGLKACIARMMKLTKQYDFPAYSAFPKAYQHDPLNLLRLARLEVARKEEAVRDRQFRLNWLTVKQWKVESRYDLSGAQQAEGLFNAVAGSRHGVLRWIRQHW